MLFFCNFLLHAQGEGDLGAVERHGLRLVGEALILEDRAVLPGREGPAQGLLRGGLPRRKQVGAPERLAVQQQGDTEIAGIVLGE